MSESIGTALPEEMAMKTIEDARKFLANIRMDDGSRQFNRLILNHLESLSDRVAALEGKPVAGVEEAKAKLPQMIAQLNSPNNGFVSAEEASRPRHCANKWCFVPAVEGSEYCPGHAPPATQTAEEFVKGFIRRATGSHGVNIGQPPYWLACGSLAEQSVAVESLGSELLTGINSIVEQEVHRQSRRNPCR